MSRLFALRIDVFAGLKERLIKWLGLIALGWIVAYEKEGDNEHVHLIISSENDIKKIRRSFNHKFPEVVGNAGYSLKLCNDDFDAYIRYICKGSDKDTLPVIWSRQGLDYTSEAIVDAHHKYWVNNDALKENSLKRRKVEKENIVEQCEKEAKKLGLKGHDRVEVAKIYMRLFRDARKGINVFAARSVVNTVCLLLDDANNGSENLLAMKIADL